MKINEKIIIFRHIRLQDLIYVLFVICFYLSMVLDNAIAFKKNLSKDLNIFQSS